MNDFTFILNTRRRTANTLTGGADRVLLVPSARVPTLYWKGVQHMLKKLLIAVVAVAAGAVYADLTREAKAGLRRLQTLKATQE